MVSSRLSSPFSIAVSVTNSVMTLVSDAGALRAPAFLDANTAPVSRSTATRLLIFACALVSQPTKMSAIKDSAPMRRNALNGSLYAYSTAVVVAEVSLFARGEVQFELVAIEVVKEDLPDLTLRHHNAPVGQFVLA